MGKSQNADSLSVLAMKQTDPNLWIAEIPLSIVMCLRENYPFR